VTGGVLVIGYGNPLRGDDGIGPAVAAAVAALNLPGVRVRVVHQLTPELAADLADARVAVFVDAADGGEPVAAVRVEPSPDGGVMTHAADPRGLLALAVAVFGRAPEAWLVTAAGADFGFRDGLTAAGAENARAAAGRVERLVREAAGA
jgi:hydrogenase maturation protease